MRIGFSLFEEDGDNMMQQKGIDVSKYQGIIDWKKVKASGVSFAFIRVGYAEHEGKVIVDTTFEYNIKNATSNGVDVGVYLYSYCKTASAAQKAAKEVLALVKPYKLTYPVAFDIEDNLYVKFNKTLNAQIALAFLNEIKAAKYYGILYTYTYFMDSYLEKNLVKGFDLWIADYREKLGYKGDYTIWQYSSKGKVDGIKGDVDLNYGYKDYKSVISSAGLNGAVVEKPKKYGVHVFSFDTKEQAYNVLQSLKLLNLYSEIRLLETKKYGVLIFSFESLARAVEVSQALKLLKNYYSEIKVIN